MKKILVGTIWLRQRDQTKWIENYQKLDWCGLKSKFYIQSAEDGFTRDEAIGAGKEKDKNVCKNYNILRKELLKQKSDYFLLWEDDVYVPKNALQILVGQNVDVSAFVLRQWYKPMIDAGIKYGSWKAIWDGVFGPEDCSKEGKWIDLQYNEKEPDVCGLGFVLLKRKVLEKIDFVSNKHFPLGCDVNFWIDARLNGFSRKIINSPDVLHKEILLKELKSNVKVDDICNRIKDIYGWFGKAELLELQKLNMPKNPVVLECGTFIGRSAKAMELLWGVDVHTCDPFNHPQRIDLKHFYNVKGIDMQWDKPIDLLYIDDAHTYQSVKENYEKFEPYVKKGGYIIFHDYLFPHINEPKGEKEFIDELDNCEIKGNRFKMAVCKKGENE